MVSSSTKLPVVARKHAIAEVACYKNHAQTFLVQEVLGKLPPERPLNPSTSYPSRWNHLAQLGTPNSIAWSILPYRHLGMTITVVTHAAFNYIDHQGSSWEHIFSCQLHLAGNIIKVHVFPIKKECFQISTCAKKSTLHHGKRKKNGCFSGWRRLSGHTAFSEGNSKCARTITELWDVKCSALTLNRNGQSCIGGSHADVGPVISPSKPFGKPDRACDPQYPEQASPFEAVLSFRRHLFSFLDFFASFPKFGWKGQWMKKGMNENTCLI